MNKAHCVLKDKFQQRGHCILFSLRPHEQRCKRGTIGTRRYKEGHETLLWAGNKNHTRRWS